ncbi:annexin-like protein RJ4 [Iris pallida]|uniref:Annexin-like protein RJ4 n=1 Tax=Iris pallida TaxID=29817 RepID=A0AAX6DG94_IRIPA|nr:annexin-like protein RJ4 [Iris pallida]KAJ6806514.1 annexin-like protein RJ4 [Iris pallida]
MATLKVPHSVPSAVEDAETLRKAFQGWGTDEKTVIGVLAHRDAAQRLQIRLAYEELYEENLIKRLESEIHGDFERAVYRWIFDPVERQAILANIAARDGDYRVVIELSCVNSANELLAVKQAYHARYKHSLEEDVASQTTGDFRKLLVALVGTYRYDGVEINLRLAESEAKILHEAITEKAYNHEEIIRILSTRSKEQLNATFNRYKDDFGISITKDLTSESSDDFVAALRVVIRCIRSPQKYFEKLLRGAIDNHGNKDAITRVLVTRAEKDLAEIKDIYEKRTNASLDEAIRKKTSGDYEKFLLALLGN